MEQSLLDGRDLRSSDDDGIVSEYKRMHYSTMMGTDSSSDEESENNFIEEEEESSAESKRDDDIDQYDLLEDEWNEFHSNESVQFAESANSDARPLPIATHPSTLPKISMSLKDVNNDEDSANALVNEDIPRNVLPAYQRIAPLTADHIFKIKEVMRGVKINPRSGPIVNIIEKLEGTRIGDENQESL